MNLRYTRCVTGHALKPKPPVGAKRMIYYARETARSLSTCTRAVAIAIFMLCPK